jgi:hypothetical protein
MSSGDVLCRFLLGLAGTLASASLVEACAIEGQTAAVLGAGQERGAWATPVELAWLDKLGRWNEGRGATHSVLLGGPRRCRPGADRAAPTSTHVLPACVLPL